MEHRNSHDDADILRVIRMAQSVPRGDGNAAILGDALIGFIWGGPAEDLLEVIEHLSDD